jgi:hypothetical protein
LSPGFPKHGLGYILGDFAGLGAIFHKTHLVNLMAVDMGSE